ncbi:hypothetical protein ACQEVZ_60685 [Dactylosporangium sp. CA-152071]|uniref:hypothetical protein n=1 Tax=Dactylosporangium sp. CA-152071 TaxID=3239933 RepID=UPI003D937F12
MSNAISLLTLRVADPTGNLKAEADLAAGVYAEGGAHAAAGMTAALVLVAEELLKDLHEATGADPQTTLQRIALRHAGG